MLKIRALLLAFCGLLFASSAFAHVSISGQPIANTNQVLTFNVGHGCGPADTVGVTIAIPSSVTTVRALVGPDGFGEPTISRDETDAVTAVTYRKAESRDADDLFYQFALRIRVPNTPFATLAFVVTQTCIVEGEEVEMAWDGSSAEYPPASTRIIPARFPGWNRYTVASEITNLAIFNDAEIVWSGDAAYSVNPNTTALIAQEEGVTALTTIAAGAEIWVKY